MPRKTQGSTVPAAVDRNAVDGGSAYRIDELDRSLIALLRSEGRASNRSLAESLGVNEATVATRLRRLEDEAVVRVVAVTDMAAFGYELLAFAFVRVAGRPVLEVGAELAQLEECIGVVPTTGRVDLVLSVLARDRIHLAELVGSSVPSVPGVDEVRWQLALDVLKYASEWAVLGTGDLPTEPRSASDAVDPLDLRIIGLLQQDARSSNRRIAAELGVSEGTVRTRIRRMEDDRVIRIQAISDIRAFGLSAGAYVGVRTRGGAVDEVARRIVAEVPVVNAVIRSVGDWELLLVMSAESRADLIATVLEHIAAIPGVRRTETIEHCGTLKHSYTWARVL